MPSLILFDRSRSTCDWQCPRRRYWTYDFQGRGIVPAGNPLELYLGEVVHAGLAAIAGQHPNVDIDVISTHASLQVYESLIAQGNNAEEAYTFAKEQSTLVEGLLRGFYRHAWPLLMATYPIIGPIEQEMTYTVSRDLIFMAKPDLILFNADRTDAAYLEWKTTSSKDAGWIDSWNTAVQLHSTVKAIEATTGIKVSNVIVQGLYKGYFNKKYQRQESAFCYCYKKAGNPPFSSDQITFDYKPGFKKFPVWELEGDIKKWVDDMPENILMDQFPCTPPIFVKDDLVERFFAQRSIRESEIANAKLDLESLDCPLETNHVLDRVFPQRFDNCHPFIGKPCPFRRLCHGHTDNPLEEGFQWREPHHQPELEAFEANNER